MTVLHVEVPATSANLGPGFDALALTLQMTDVVRAEVDPSSRDVVLAHVEGDLDLDPHRNLLCEAYRAWGTEAGIDLPGVRFSLQVRIPPARGLGSSAASVVAGLAVAARVAGTEHPRQGILRLATRIEGHPDNGVAAVMGGLTVGFCDGGDVHALHVANHLAMRAVLFVPRAPLLTEKARAVLPPSVPLADAVANIGRTAYLITALSWGRWESIRPAMDDRLHQPYRTDLIPHLGDIMRAAVEAGAYGSALSGGGPSVIALASRQRAPSVAAAMSAAAEDSEGETLVLEIREQGYTLREEKEQGDEKTDG